MNEHDFKRRLHQLLQTEWVSDDAPMNSNETDDQVPHWWLVQKFEHTLWQMGAFKELFTLGTYEIYWQNLLTPPAQPQMSGVQRDVETVEHLLQHYFWLLETAIDADTALRGDC